jgi:hypothetical protein
MRKLILGAFLLLCALPTQATITHLANDAGGNGTTSPQAVTITSTTAHNLMVVGVMWQPTTSTASVSCSASGAMTASSLGQVNNGTNAAAELFYIQNSTGGDTSCTITVASATRITSNYFEFSGNATSGGEDGTGSGTGSSTTLVTGANVVSVGTTNVAIGFGATSTGGETWTAGTSFTLNTLASTNRGVEEFQIFTSAVNQTVGMSFNTSAPWVMLATTFKAASTGGPNTTLGGSAVVGGKVVL